MTGKKFKCTISLLLSIIFIAISCLSNLSFATSSLIIY